MGGLEVEVRGLQVRVRRWSVVAHAIEGSSVSSELFLFYLLPHLSLTCWVGLFHIPLSRTYNRPPPQARASPWYRLPPPQSPRSSAFRKLDEPVFGPAPPQPSWVNPGFSGFILLVFLSHPVVPLPQSWWILVCPWVSAQPCSLLEDRSVRVQLQGSLTLGRGLTGSCSLKTGAPVAPEPE